MLLNSRLTGTLNHRLKHIYFHESLQLRANTFRKFSDINIQNPRSTKRILPCGKSIEGLFCRHKIKLHNLSAIVPLFRKYALTLKGEDSKPFSSQSNFNGANERPSFINQFIKTWRKNPLPIWVGLVLIAALQYRRVRNRKYEQEEPCIFEPVEAKPISLRLVQAYEQMPLDFISRIVGYIFNNTTLPVWAREPVISWYARTFQCKVYEAEKGDDWVQYKSLGEFFRRRLKKEVRPIHHEAILITPCDGRVLSCGSVDIDGKLEQVKGISYSLKEFLGDYEASITNSKEKRISETPLYKPKKHTRLYHCTMYLAPGDYHCFHAPADWTIELRRHFIGKLLSVRPSLLSKIPHLLSLNERVVYYGKWNPLADSSASPKDNANDYFIAFAAVGATNVGSIIVEMDQSLKTNIKHKFEKDKCIEEHFSKQNNLRNIQKGAYFGEFNLGSTIVIVFEAPLDFTFNVQPGQTVYVGQPLAHG